MDLKVAAALIPCFELDWVDDEDEKQRIVQQINLSVKELYEESTKKESDSDKVVQKRKTDFFVFRKSGPLASAEAAINGIVDRYIFSGSCEKEKTMSEARFHQVQHSHSFFYPCRKII